MVTYAVRMTLLVSTVCSLYGQTASEKQLTFDAESVKPGYRA